MGIKIAILDDSVNVSQRVADWSVLVDAETVGFTDTLNSEVALIERLHGFDVVCLMRKRHRLATYTYAVRSRERPPPRNWPCC